jgi:hypothetical protein
LIAHFAIFCFILPPIHELQSAGLSDAVLFVALFAKPAPPPIAASPDNLVKVTHREKLSEVKSNRKDFNLEWVFFEPGCWGSLLIYSTKSYGLRVSKFHGDAVLVGAKFNFALFSRSTRNAVTGCLSYEKSHKTH